MLKVLTEYVEVTVSIVLVLPAVFIRGGTEKTRQDEDGKLKYEDNRELISDYLNNKLYTDPEFFGDFGPENIASVRSL